MYLTFEDYTKMGGKLDEGAFNDYALEAQSEIDWYTFNRLQGEEEIPEQVKTVMYLIIRLFQKRDALLGLDAPSGGGGESDGSQGGLIASQSNDGVSITYSRVSGSETYDLLSRRVESTIRKNLHGVTNSIGRKLLYRGLYPGE